MNLLKNSAVITVVIAIVFLITLVFPRVIETDREAIVGNYIVIYYGTISDKPSTPELDSLINNPIVKRVRWLVPTSKFGSYLLYEWDRNMGWTAMADTVAVD